MLILLLSANLINDAEWGLLNLQTLTHVGLFDFLQIQTAWSVTIPANAPLVVQRVVIVDWRTRKVLPSDYVDVLVRGYDATVGWVEVRREPQVRTKSAHDFGHPVQILDMDMTRDIEPTEVFAPDFRLGEPMVKNGEVSCLGGTDSELPW